jgi:hypothetical protein
MVQLHEEKSTTKSIMLSCRHYSLRQETKASSPQQITYNIDIIIFNLILS